MKRLRTVICFMVIGLSCIFFSCATTNAVWLRYNETDRTIIVMNGESAKHISQINLDLRQDTLFIDVFKKMVFLRNSVINSATTNWKIKLVPAIKFVSFSGKVLPLSELAVYPQKGLGMEQTYYPSIEIFPKKFPYVAK